MVNIMVFFKIKKNQVLDNKPYKTSKSSEIITKVIRNEKNQLVPNKKRKILLCTTFYCDYFPLLKKEKKSIFNDINEKTKFNEKTSSLQF